MNENHQSEVFIEREGKAFRWGQSEYFKTWNGLKKTLSLSALQATALPIAILIGIITFLFSAEKEVVDFRGNPVQVPSINQESTRIQAPILEQKDLINQIPRPKVQVGVVGRIKVFNLRGHSDIPVGSEAKAVLESGASNGIVKAKLVTALQVDGENVLPEGTTIFGKGRSTDERLLIEFRKAIFPNGESFPILAQAFDVSDKILGLKGSFVGTRTKKMGIAIGFGVLGGMAEGLQDTSGSSIWGGGQKKSARDAALSGASRAALDQSQVYIDEMKSAPVVIEVKKGTEFYMIVDEPVREENH